MGKVPIFKPQVGKMFFGQITGRQNVIKKNKKTALEKVVLKVT